MEHTITYGPRDVNAGIVSLPLAKANAKIEYEDEDVLLQVYLDAITDEIENFCARTFVKREVNIGFSQFTKKIELPVSANVVIDEIVFNDENGDPVLLVQDTDYKVFSYDNGYKQRVVFLLPEFPQLQDLEENEYPITITATAGFDSDAMPADIKRAALLMFNNAEAYREDMPVHLNRSAQAILRSHKRY